MEWVLTFAILGLLCVLAEVFLPGGVLGVLGFLLIGASVVMAYHRLETGGFVLYLAGLAIVGGLFFLIGLRIMPTTPLGKALFLRSTQKDYDVSVAGRQEMVGKEGIALSFLRPTGVAEIGGKRVNVITEGEFIEKNVRVRVSELKDNQLVVRRAGSETPQPKETT